MLIQDDTHMRSHPNYGMKGRFLVTVYRLVAGGEVGVLEQLAAVSAESLDVLVVGLAQLPLEAPVHGPVPAEGALLVINAPGGPNTWDSSPWHHTSPRGDRNTSSTSTTSSSSSSTSSTRLSPTVQPLPHLFGL